LRKLVPARHLPMLVALLVALGVGLYLVPDYGESVDESNMYAYVQYAMDDYRLFRHPGELADYDGPGAIKSPYYLVGGFVVRALAHLKPAWSSPTSWHFIYFVTFLAGAAALYGLALRWMSTAAAFSATLLYLTQPLFWGHAFINPKDVPMTALFLASVYAGLRMTDRPRTAPWIDGWVVPAAVLLGIATATRVVAPLAGIIVLVHAVSRLGSRGAALAITYVVLAAAFTYVSWPFLWGRPAGAYFGTVRDAASFDFSGSVLFRGEIHSAMHVPWSYFPTLVGIQLTEPALVLFVAGIVFAVLDFRGGRGRAPLLLFVAWCLVPVLLVIGAGSTLYNNGRQLYFLLPPVFLVAGMAFDRLFKLRLGPAAQASAVLLAILPGILASFSLHPYEYIYYNSLAGGTRGARGQFEMDYWATSYGELASYANATFVSGSRIRASKPGELFRRSLRPDMEIVRIAPYDYAAYIIGRLAPEDPCPGAETIYSVERSGVVFAVLKRTPDGTGCK